MKRWPHDRAGDWMRSKVAPHLAAAEQQAKEFFLPYRCDGEARLEIDHTFPDRQSRLQQCLKSPVVFHKKACNRPCFFALSWSHPLPPIMLPDSPKPPDILEPPVPFAGVAAPRVVRFYSGMRENAISSRRRTEGRRCRRLAHPEPWHSRQETRRSPQQQILRVLRCVIPRPQKEYAK